MPAIDDDKVENNCFFGFVDLKTGMMIINIKLVVLAILALAVGI